MYICFFKQVEILMHREYIHVQDFLYALFILGEVMILVIRRKIFRYLALTCLVGESQGTISR